MSCTPSSNPNQAVIANEGLTAQVPMRSRLERSPAIPSSRTPHLTAGVTLPDPRVENGDDGRQAFLISGLLRRVASPPPHPHPHTNSSRYKPPQAQVQALEFTTCIPKNSGLVREL
jgi:hypothetical protein